MTEPNYGLDEAAGLVLAELERRSAERYPCALKPGWSELGARTDHQSVGEVRDISTGGLAMCVDRRLNPGTVLVIQLQGASHKLSRPMPVRVMHARQLPGGEWHLGCAFVRSLSRADLHDLLNES